jgi:hypothetical protein
MNYPIPPWLSQGADPARQYAGGFALGMRMGESQAAQALQQQAMLREQQKDEFDRQYKNTVLQVQIEDALRKQRAQSAFRDMVQGGADPMEALMRAGPEMGESMGDLLRTRAMMENAKKQEDARTAQAQQRQQEQEGKGLRWLAEMEQRNRGLKQREDAGAENRAMREQQLMISAQRAINSDPALVGLRDKLRVAMTNLNKAQEAKATEKWFGGSDKTIDKLAAEVKRIQERIQEQEGILLAPFGLSRGQSLTPEQVAEKYKSGELTYEQAAAALKQLGLQ